LRHTDPAGSIMVLFSQRWSRGKRFPAIAAIAWGVLGAPYAAEAQSLQKVSPLTFDLNVSGISANGVTVIGVDIDNPMQALQWSAAAGTSGLGFASGLSSDSYATGASADGSVIVGSSDNTSQVQATMWTAAGGMVPLGFPAGEIANLAEAVSANGSVVVGFRLNSAFAQAFSWTAAGGFTNLGMLSGDDSSVAYGVNVDGSVVVGSSTNSSTGSAQAMRWTAASGMVGLGFLPGDTFSIAHGVNADGSVVVGESGALGISHAFRWTATSGMVNLGTVPLDSFAVAYAVNADGSVVVGQSSGGSSFFGDQAFIWTAANGMQSIQALLSAAGVPVGIGQGQLFSNLSRATGVSADGTVIAGTGVAQFRSDQGGGWVATLPLPKSACSGSAVVNTTGQSAALQLATTGAAAASPLVAAVLPASRSVEVCALATATAFATIINAGSTTASSCTIAPLGGLPLNFLYQTTNPTTNALTGTANTPIDIAAGAAQSFLIALTPRAALKATNVNFSFACANATAAPTQTGLNTLLLSASTSPVPDIVALGASGDPGIVDIPGASGTGVFAVATVNLGADATITASANTGAATLPVTVSICQTVPATGACMASPAASVTTDIQPNTTPTFGIFAAGGGSVPFDPANNRVFVQFADPSGNVRGETSVAVRTQ
jgi:probable HAF family extracellular repeat protein